MLDLHYWPTPNGWKVAILLEECGLDDRIVPVDIGAGDQFKAEFLRISPNNRMTAIVDIDPVGGGEPIAIFESGAILEYLADKAGRFLPRETRNRFRVLQWVYWQMANLGPMIGNAYHFKNYAIDFAADPRTCEYGAARFLGEVDRLCSVMDARLSATEFLAGDSYSIADMAAWPWAMMLGWIDGGAYPPLPDDGAEVWRKFPSVKRWVDQVGARPAVQRGRAIGRELTKRKLAAQEEEARRRLLYNQDSEKVRKAREDAARAGS